MYLFVIARERGLPQAVRQLAETEAIPWLATSGLIPITALI